jgi:hypothetical protein
MAVKRRGRALTRKRKCSRRSRRRQQRGGNPSGVLEVSWPGGAATAAPGPLLSRGLVAAPPSVKILSPSPNPLLLVCTDPDAPSPNNPWLHWLRRLSRGQEDIVPWAPPTPPAGSGIHRYQFRLFEAPGLLPPLKPPATRAAFPLEDFVAQNRLKLLDMKEVRVAAAP